ncbi:MAG: aminotransferase class I/II-fold pyridoxal phosphate-dependent enzyme [Actinomycetota bacterium]|nr:aminotransferase class I/II-fold pyridoxal phosphate-dependent enzyme [Actinomycetota bacterium]
MTQPVARRMQAVERALRPFLRVMRESTYARRMGTSGIMDFMAGNPQEPPLPEVVEVIARWTRPRSRDWFAYRVDESRARAAAAAGLRERLEVEVDPDDVVLTRGAAGGLAAALAALTEPGDQVIFLSPPWFFYEAMILATGAEPVRVRVDPTTFNIDVEALEEAISPRTRVVILNTPNNPTGRIYPPETLEQVAAVIERRAARSAQPIAIISDESYSRILFDGRRFHSPARFSPNCVLVHTTSKSTLTPGQRLGFVALPKTMPGRERIRDALRLAILVQGIAVPDAVMQFAFADLEPLCIDLAHLQRKRDRMVEALRQHGYQLDIPEGAFYLLPRSPLADDIAFAELLARRDVFVLPGSVVEMPGYFRISLTASDEMIERALPIFAAALVTSAAVAGSQG